MVYEMYHTRSPSTTKLMKTFLKYASVSIDGQQYMSCDDFVRKFLEVFPNTKISDELVRVLAGMADYDRDGVISFHEFEQFERLLDSSESLYGVVFQMFDRKGTGLITYPLFVDIIKMTEMYVKFPFNFEGPLIRQYFGADRQRANDYTEFCQLLRDYGEEYTKQVFQSKDNGSGYISSEDFRQILLGLKRRLITGAVADKLSAITDATGDKISYPYYKAFTSLLDNMESIKYVYLDASKGSRRKEISMDNMLRASQPKGVTPLQIEILFELLWHTKKKETVSYKDLCSIIPQHDAPIDRSVFVQILESLYRFSLGSIAGATGAFAVYPIDLVKTRMQNQRIKDGIKTYNNILDCFLKVIRNEGVLGLYRGVPVQVLGIAPEKALKLTINDFVRGKFTDEHGQVALRFEILAGCCAGFAQDLITNPLEIVKIRLQTAGEVGQKLRAIPIIRELGIRGLYRGVRACLMRDIPFAAIYFPCYAHLKKAFTDKNGYNTPGSLLAAGFLAGIPAASLVTPADVIKTRLQVVARTGQTKYKGVIDAATKVMREEGPTAFWKGVVPRVLRSSPQLGITLITYELLQRVFYVDFGGHRPEGSEKKLVEDTAYTINPDHIGAFKNAVPVLNSIESKFGLCLPRFGRPMK